MKTILLLLFLFLAVACAEQQLGSSVSSFDLPILTLTGDMLTLPPPSESIQYRLDTVTTNYIDQLIWYGRFTAYAGDYYGAIRIFTEGIEKFPEEPRFFRHRGHRYISIRKFDEAISDLKKASTLITGQPNQVEQDGMPNAQNIPVSTLHGNIWYHLGLAYYLKQDWPKALDAYKNCLASTQNDDNIVSATHWLYMIARRMGDEDIAGQFLDVIKPEMSVIENQAYHRLCLFYNGLITVEELQNPNGAPSSNDAVEYGIGNWYFYNGGKEEAREIFEQITARPSWNSFGYIAAEADLFYEFPSQ